MTRLRSNDGDTWSPNRLRSNRFDFTATGSSTPILSRLYNTSGYLELEDCVLVFSGNDSGGFTDGARINAAIDRADALGLKVVRMLPGIYYTDVSISVDVPVSLIGYSRDSTTIVAKSSLTAPTLLIKIELAPGGDTNANAGQRYGGFTVDAEDTAGSLSDAISISDGAGNGLPKGSTMDDIRIIGGYKGLKILRNGGRCQFFNFHIYNCRNDGVDYDWGSEGENTFAWFYIEAIGGATGSAADIWGMRFHGGTTDAGGVIVAHCKVTHDGGRDSGGVLVKGDDTHTADTFGAAYVAFTDVTADGMRDLPAWKFLNALNVRGKQLWGLLDENATIAGMVIEYAKDIHIMGYFSNIPSASPAHIAFSGRALRSSSKQSGTADAGTNTTTLVDAAADFVTAGVVAGDIVEITSGTGVGEFRYVQSRDSATQLTIVGTWSAVSGSGFNVGASSNDNNLISIFGIDSTNTNDPIFTVTAQSLSNPVGIQNLAYGGTIIAGLTALCDSNANLDIIAKASARNFVSGMQVITHGSSDKAQTFALTDGGSNKTKWLRVNGDGDIEILDDAFGSVLFQLKENGAIRLKEVSAPGTPATGFVYFYAKSDGRLYSKDDAGTESGPL